MIISLNFLKNAKIEAIVVSVVICFSSCNKSPAADFTVNKTEFIPGEVIVLTNNSSDAWSYTWTLPDGQTSKAENVDYKIHLQTLAGVYQIKLNAFSKKGDKSSEAIKKVTVK